MFRLPTRSLALVAMSLLPTSVAAAEPPLSLTDATFTDRVEARQPGARLTSYNLPAETAPRLYFWFRLECGSACLEEPGATPEIPIYVKWAHEERDAFVVKDTIPLTVRGRQWRAWTYKENLEPGTWRVAIFTEEGPVCLEDQCQFTVQVTP